MVVLALALRMALERSQAGFTLGLVAALVVIAVAGIFTTLRLDTCERTRDVAVLKAIGVTPLQVATMVITSAAVPVIAGGVLGAALGLVLRPE
jgi:putative ABC transport system permease protein